MVVHILISGTRHTPLKQHGFRDANHDRNAVNKARATSFFRSQWTGRDMIILEAYHMDSSGHREFKLE